jgi:AcrR family transcriptional regulator
VPRKYERRKRLVATTQTRARIVAAARELLTSPEGAGTFTVDAVAQRADVARMTVYYQFKSKRRVLEAVFDDFAERTGLQRLREVFVNPDPGAALGAFVERFVRAWSSDRIMLRHLYGLAALDSEIEASLAERIGWRRDGLAVLLSRLKPNAGNDALDALVMLTGFETYDALAARGRKPRAIVAMIRRLAHAALGCNSYEDLI